MRLLPPNPEIGWTPYGWLIYLSLFVAQPAYRGASAAEWALTAGVLAVFLALYFRGYWLEGRQLVPIVLSIAALGLALMPWNPGASVFVIYAAAFVGFMAPSARVALPWLLGLVAAVLVEAALVPLRPMIWAPAVVFSLLIGGANLHFAEVSRSNARLRAAQREAEQLAKVEERERIARDLHDLLGHTLSVIALKAELASKLSEHEPGRAGREIRDVERISRDALGEVRRAVEGFRARGLAAELESARRALAAADVAAEPSVDAVALPPAVEGVLALVLREAVANVVRHADASRCRIRVEAAADSVCLEVEDDGNGAGGPEGSGLRGMRERVVALGGSLTRASGAGTRLTVVLPLAATPP